MSRFLRVFFTGIDLQLLNHGVAQGSLREHALNSDFKGAARVALLHLFESRFDDAARITRVAIVTLVLSLVATHLHLGSVDHNDEIARINVRRVFRLVLATQTGSNFSSEVTNDLIGGVNHVPFASHFERLSREGLHYSFTYQ